MKSFICLLACVAYASAVGVVGVEDDGQWRPWLDGSILGASPGLATAALGAADVPVVAHTGVIAARHGLLGGHLIAKRSAIAALPVAHTAVVTPHVLPTTAIATTHSAVIAPSVYSAGLWGHGLYAHHGLLGGHLIAKRSLGFPVVASRIVPAAALAHNAQVVAPAVPTVYGAGLWGHGLAARHWW